MSPNQPPRRFAPTPLETTTKSGRQGPQTDGETPRRFNVQPVETSVKSSKETGPSNREVDLHKQPMRRFSPQPVETSRTSFKDAQQVLHNARRFAPQPVETSAKSSRDKQEAPRKFAPQPVETSSRSSRNNSTEKPRSRFLPHPIETSTKSKRAKAASDEPLSPTSKPQASSSDKPAKRKFTPQLLDTSARSRKSTDTRTVSAADKTDHVAGVKSVSYNNCGLKIEHPEMPPTSTPEHLRFLMPFERRKERSDSRASARSHSFRLPDLETIESSESEPSNPPSLSTSPSSNDVPLNGPLSEMYRHATRIRESVDETFGRYLLELEARRAEQKLQDQALAAFPNSDYHEPVAHYVDEESEGDEIDDRPATWEGHEDDVGATSFARNPHHRDTTHGTFEIREMQQHHEELEQERKAANTTARRRSSGVSSSPWWNPAGHDYAGSVQRDPELKSMQDRARPPMLGADLLFPRSASPEPARFDVTQGSQQLRSQMCYLTQQSGAEVSPEGLWGGKKQNSSHDPQHALSQKSTHSNRSTLSAADPERRESQGGLWGGFCVWHPPPKGGLAPPRGPSGLMTPLTESANPFEASGDWKLPPPITLPVTPPSTGEQGPQIDIILSDEEELDQLMENDYPDSFVTQVYNYLSLGYPSLARPFDEELSKISHVPVSELRHDDEIAKQMPKGYIRLGDDFEGRGDGTDQELKDGGCARWKALKAYIREWARQEKNMVKTEGLAGNWGTNARRGSWAW